MLRGRLEHQKLNSSEIIIISDNIKLCSYFVLLIIASLVSEHIQPSFPGYFQPYFINFIKWDVKYFMI